MSSLGFRFWNNWFAECTDENFSQTFQHSGSEVNTGENQILRKTLWKIQKRKDVNIVSIFKMTNLCDGKY